MKCFDKSCRHNQNTHIQYHFLSKIVAVYEIMWENIVERGRPQMTIKCLFAWWITKNTNTHTEYRSLNATVAQQNNWTFGVNTTIELKNTALHPAIPSRLLVQTNTARWRQRRYYTLIGHIGKGILVTYKTHSFLLMLLSHLVLIHYNNSCTKAHHYYVIRTLPAFFL